MFTHETNAFSKCYVFPTIKYHYLTSLIQQLGILLTQGKTKDYDLLVQKLADPGIKVTLVNNIITCFSLQIQPNQSVPVHPYCCMLTPLLKTKHNNKFGLVLISNEVLVYMIEFKKLNFQCLIKQYSNALDKVLYVALTWTFG